MDISKQIIVSLLFFPAFVTASDYRIVIPTVSKHIGSDVYTVEDEPVRASELTGSVHPSGLDPLVEQSHIEEFNNENFGLGFEIRNEGLIYTLAAVKNSYEENSIVLGLSKESRLSPNWHYSYGATVANGYEQLSSSGYLVSPTVSLRFMNFRLSTTYPFSSLTCPSDECSDVINLQLVVPF